MFVCAWAAVPMVCSDRILSRGTIKVGYAVHSFSGRVGMSASDVSGRSALFPEPEGDVAETGEILQDGILPSQDIRELIRKGHIRAYPEIAEQQIQPASLDLRLGDVAYRVQASFLPRRATVEQIIQDLQLRMVRVDL